MGRAPERPMKAPDVKPNMVAKPMPTDELSAGIQTANSAIPERVQATMNIFHLPTTSAPYPETSRPKRLETSAFRHQGRMSTYLAALKMDTKYCAIPSDMCASSKPCTAR